MPWIHVDDAAAMFVHAAEANVSGVWNATAPNPVRNAQFTSELGTALHRPTLLPIPAIALKLAFGELGGRMLDSARVLPQAALTAGFPFRYPELAGALARLYP